MDIILIGFWIWERAQGRTKLKFRAWLQMLDAEGQRMQAEAPAGWQSSQQVQDLPRTELVDHRASSSLSFSR